jgi:hypothetical protein
MEREEGQGNLRPVIFTPDAENASRLLKSEILFVIDAGACVEQLHPTISTTYFSPGEINGVGPRK